MARVYWFSALNSSSVPHSLRRNHDTTDMRQEKTSTLTEILAQGRLGSLRERSRRLERLDALLGFYLDLRLRQQVQVAGYQDGTLVLACANSTVAGQLRYLSRIYMQQLRQHAEFCDLGRIKAVMAPTPAAARRPPRPPRQLSPAAAGLLRSLADDLGGGEISEALQRLARHGDAVRDPDTGRPS